MVRVAGGGQGGGGGGPAAPPQPKPSPYANPFRAVRGLVPSRVDMGVDYSGSGDVYALGPGVITAAHPGGPGSPWYPCVGCPPAETAWITERLIAGPLAGQQVYVAEGIRPSVRPGQRVDSSTVIGTMFGGIETGFAAQGGAGAGGETAAAAAGQQAQGGDPGAVPTAYGLGYSSLLHRLGAPPGAASGPPSGSLPGWLQGVLNAISPGAAVAGSGAVTAGGGVLGTLGQLGTALDWLVNPTHWVRIIAGIGGGVMVLAGAWALTHVGGELPMAGQLTKGSSLPIGIALVGGGGILLFVAFHNLPSSVTDLGSLAGYMDVQLHSPKMAKVLAG